MRKVRVAYSLRRVSCGDLKRSCMSSLRCSKDPYLCDKLGFLECLCFIYKVLLKRNQNVVPIHEYSTIYILCMTRIHNGAHEKSLQTNVSFLYSSGQGTSQRSCTDGVRWSSIKFHVCFLWSASICP